MKILFSFIFICLLTAAGYGQTLYPFRNSETKLFGFKDAKDNIVIEAVYQKAASFTDGLSCVKKNGKYGFINKQGTVVVPIKYYAAVPFSGGMAEVSTKENKWGYINKAGVEIVKPVYLLTHPFSEGYAAVNSKGKWGFIDTTGKLVVPLKYQLADEFHEGLVCVALNNKWGVIDSRDVQRTGFFYDAVLSFSEGRLAARKGDLWGFIDRSGLNLIRPADKPKEETTDFDYLFSDAFIDFGFTSTDSLNFKFRDVGSFSEGLAPIKVNGAWGFLDTTGKVAIDHRYKEVHYFNQGIAAVNTELNFWRYIDKKGKSINDKTYESGNDFRNGYVIVTSLGVRRKGVINTAGKEVVECKYDEVRRIPNGFAVSLNGKWTEVDFEGKEIK